MSLPPGVGTAGSPRGRRDATERARCSAIGVTTHRGRGPSHPAFSRVRRRRVATVWANALPLRPFPMTSLANAYTVVVPGAHLMSALLGQRDGNLRLVETAFPDATVSVRGNEISVEGPRAEVVGRLFEELVVLLQRGQDLDEASVRRSIDMVVANERPSSVLTDDI